jgi:hypothetical protein
MEFRKLVHCHAKGVFRIHEPLPQWAVDFAMLGGWRVAQIYLGLARDKNAFLNATAKALQFPAYFAHNWDAFYENLLHLDRAKDTSWLLVLREASAFAGAEPEEFAAALAALEDAGEDWASDAGVLVAVAELQAPVLAPELQELTLPVK